MTNEFKAQNSKLFNALLLLVWITVGSGLRFAYLSAKSPWTDEFSTLVFSLGNSFRSVPLDQAIALNTLLQPLQLHKEVGVADVIHHLLSESNHPPLYFVLAHWWMKLLITPLASLVNGQRGEYMSIWAARSLPALFGVTSIPAIYGLSRIAFRSPLVAQLSAAMMAVSPYGIYLAQEARHYTLAILFVIASFSGLVVAAQHIQQSQPLPLWIALTWLIINILGISTHYFFTLTIAAEAIVLLALVWCQTIGTKENCWTQSEQKENLENDGDKTFPFSKVFSSPLLVLAASTVVGGVVWLPIWLKNYNNELTQWIYTDERIGWVGISPIFQVLADWMTTICLLPVEASNLTVVIASAVVTDIFFLWVLPILYRGLKAQLHQIPDLRLATQVLGGVVGSAIALFFFFTYVLGINLTWQARYHFVYVPAVIVLLAASLAAYWNIPEAVELTHLSPSQKSAVYTSLSPPFFIISGGKISVALIWLVGFLSGVTVVCNLGYQKYYRPDLFVPLIQEISQVPVLIATPQKTHKQTGEMMGIAWEFKHSGSSVNPQFLLVHQHQNPKTSSAILQQTLNLLPHPIDLWMVNCQVPIKPNNCVVDFQSLPTVKGYSYSLYHCL
jgi:uncharacterized membrane protein